MARGWESKSVEAQIDAAEDHRSAVPENTPDSKTLEAIHRKESLLLSRTRVTRELNGARNVRYKEQLAKALKELDTQLAALDSAAG